MTEAQHDLNAIQIMDAIADTQENIVRQREARVQLEVQLKEISEQIDGDLAALAELQESLNKAIAKATQKAVGGC